MSLQFVIGRSGSGKSYQLYKEIITKSIQKEDTSYLVIVPEQFTLQTQKDIVSRHPNRGTMNIDILSFNRLAFRIFDEVGGNDRPVLEDTGKSMVLRKIVAIKKKELELFNHDVQKQGFIDELKSLISEIYQYSISIPKLEEMKEAMANKPLLHGKLHDIIIIYKAFREYLDKNYITAEEILDVLCEVIDQSKLIEKSIICLDGFTGFTPAQYKLLTLLIKKAKKVLITITIDKKELDIPDEEYQLFHLSKKTIKKLTDITEEEKMELDSPLFVEDISPVKVPYRYRNSPALAALEANLFRYPSKSFEEEQDNISIHAARDIKQEIIFVVQEIKKLVRDRQYRYQDIAVVTGDIASYGREFGREFEKAGIPCFIDNKREVLSNPFVEMIRSALDIVQNKFDYESVFRYLRCGLANVEMADVDILENYVIALGIRGQKKWQDNWTRLYRGQPQGELIRINEIRQAFYDEINPLYEVLSDKEKTVKDYTLALYEFGLKMQAAEKLEAFALAFSENNKLGAAKEYEQIYGIVMELFDKLAELLGTEVISLKEYIEVLKAGLTEAKVGLIPPGLDQITVGDIERTRLKDIKALFFVGVNDGIIPKVNGSGGILTDMERQTFLEHKIEMAPTIRQAGFTEKFYLYLNMTKPQDKLYISFSKLNGDGKSIRPSYMIETIRKLFPKIKISDEDMENEDISHILGNNGGMDYIIDGLRKYPYEDPTQVWNELFSYYYAKEENKDQIQSLIQAAFYVNKERGLSKQIAKELYGSSLTGSVTRFEQYAACAFAHYISYGLELMERQEYRLAIPDIGNLFHNAIELFSRKMAASEYSWHTIPENVREEWGSQCVREAADGYGNSIFGSSSRYQYIVKRVERITKRTLWVLCEQIKKGDFEPIGFEVFFSGDNELNSLKIDLSENEGIRLLGRIDRLDIYEENDKLLVKVIDYKSGNTSFDLLSVYYGLQIQLAVYMNAAMELMEREHPGKSVIPAGILYYNIDDPLVEKSSHVEESILKELKMNGIVNSSGEVIKHLDNSFLSEGEELRPSVKSDVIPVETNKDGYPTKRSSIADQYKLKAIEKYVKDTVYHYGFDILDGKTDIKPYQMGKRSACDYCIYNSICGFDSKLNGYSYRNLASLSAEEVWDRIMKQQKTVKEGVDKDALDQ
ncbi:helicase-exonuclease AddAB subunit AddB [Anaerocolumna sp. MB42-C2]|uniref:helicase-exonuclease AddAB subunit AddB n=1 Tax=Anaerocolumna sp. MB42-C2 TaxID=3070997 RepID=UPI0027E11862|nr:helicase-exonuclease AddAB subunit AddB [Anaerocolumna sp. MB42-C2]WMJ86181.1 helicase-exonuclease AddAB subunit AddB [Anaerocolumna sp. MB42-C2]